MHGSESHGGLPLVRVLLALGVCGLLQAIMLVHVLMSTLGLLKKGSIPSFKTALVVLVLEEAESCMPLNGIMGSKTVFGLSERENMIALLSKAVLHRDTNGKLLFGVAVGRVKAEALSGFKLVDESEITVEYCKFRGLVPKGAAKEECFQKAEKLES